MTDSITCPVCGRTSYHPQDVKEGYCGNCHDWTSAPTCSWCFETQTLTKVNDRYACITHIDIAMREALSPIKRFLEQA